LLAQQRRTLAGRIAALAASESQIEREIELLRSRVAIAESAEALHAELHRKGFISKQRLHVAEAERLDQRARLAALERDRLAIVRERAGVEADLRELPLKARSRIGELERSIAQLEQERAETEARREIVIAAPQSGTVTAVQAAPGGHVGADVPLLAILPSDAELEAHLYSPTRAVGFVRPGQKVRLRYQAYAYQRFGHYEGVVSTVSRAAVSPSELPGRLAGLAGVLGLQAGAAAEPVYRITVRLESQTVNVYGEPVALQAGMLVEADVLLEKRRLIQWVLDPLYAVRAKWAG
jgi:membrane fusion protein